MTEWLLQDGWIVVVAMAILTGEIALARLVPEAHRSGFMANALAGLALLGALYAALTERAGVIVLACLGVGLLAHVLYLLAIRRQP